MCKKSVYFMEIIKYFNMNSKKKIYLNYSNASYTICPQNYEIIMLNLLNKRIDAHRLLLC